MSNLSANTKMETSEEVKDKKQQRKKDEETFGKVSTLSIKRLNISLPESTYAKLQHLAKSSGRSMTDIMRTALGLVTLAIEEEKIGNKLVVMSEDNQLLKEIVLPK